MKRLPLGIIASVFIFLSCGGGSFTNPPSNNGGTNPPPVARYALVAWSELGMHCIDGKDYSVFAVLPPYNVIHAQLIKLGNPPQVVTTGVTVTYQAVADTSGSINTTSVNKTNFWTYANPLFHAALAQDVGLTGAPVQSATPQAMNPDASLRGWTTPGIPTVPYDDQGLANAYPMALIVAKDSSGQVLAQARIVMPVSDELRCNTCHASGSNPAAQPAAGWENNPDPLKDVKLNILRLHDQHHDISGLLAGLGTSGYNYQPSLRDTALAGTPILCAVCHSSNALGTAGAPGVQPMTAAMHSLHGGVVNPANNTTLDNATTPFASCYLCHPGLDTKCLRGAMSSVTCMNCHGNLSAVGSSTRVGWMTLPACQNCHTGGNRYPTAFDVNNQWRVSADTTFATNPDVPSTGFHLYRFSKGHGALACSSCHNSPHAEFPTSQPNDNVYSAQLQGHNGAISECSVCHDSSSVSNNGGPHGMHTIGQAWVSGHGQYAENSQTVCAYCHGSDFHGLSLSQVKAARSFFIENGTRAYSAGSIVGCYDCHNGPNGG